MGFTPPVQNKMQVILREMQENIKTLFENQKKLEHNQRVVEENQKKLFQNVEDVADVADCNLDNILRIATFLGFGAEIVNEEEEKE